MPRQLTLALLALVLVVAGCGGGGGNGDGGGNGGSQGGGTPAQAAEPGGLTELQNAYTRVVDVISPSVVQIETNKGLGSGIIFDDQGDIVTNDHVVGDATSFQVTLQSGKRTSASLVGTWTPGDLAVIRAKGSGLKPATFANSSKLQVGDIVLAVGNPLGLRSSVTEGIVSSLGRSVSEGSNGVTLASAIQTSAAINPGNSGGALVDIRGQVVGIPTLAALDPELGGSAAPGIGFAIPSNNVKDIAQQLVEHGRVVQSNRAALGVEVATVTGGGVVVVGVQSGGGAAKAGMQRGDLIVSIDGKPIPSVPALSELLATKKPGDQVTVTVRRRDGSQQDLKVTLGELQGS
jgi:S1-C subfamily serine protease